MSGVTPSHVQGDFLREEPILDEEEIGREVRAFARRRRRTFAQQQAHEREQRERAERERAEDERERQELRERLREAARLSVPAPPTVPAWARGGETVEMSVGGKWVPAKVLYALTGDVEVSLRVRRVGRTRSGASYRSTRRYLSGLRPLSAPLPPEPANVYADWLEENGEARAAARLREAFPLG